MVFNFRRLKKETAFSAELKAALNKQTKNNLKQTYLLKSLQGILLLH
jgi:hypothetical protein